MRRQISPTYWLAQLRQIAKHHETLIPQDPPETRLVVAQYAARKSPEACVEAVLRWRNTTNLAYAPRS